MVEESDALDGLPVGAESVLVSEPREGDRLFLENQVCVLAMTQMTQMTRATPRGGAG